MTMHLVSGISPAAALKASKLAGDVGFIADDLSLGPLADSLPLDDFGHMRQRFWEHSFSTAGLAAFASKPGPPWSEGLQEIASRDETLVIWASRSLSDQLFVSYLAHLLVDEKVDAGLVKLVDVDVFPRTGCRVSSLGELWPEDFNVAAAGAKTMSKAICRVYRLGWMAITSQSPLSIEPTATEVQSVAPQLSAALNTFLSRFPLARHGVPHHVLRMMRSLATMGPSFARAMASCIAADADSLDRFGDFGYRAEALSLSDGKCRVPLISISGDPTKLRTLEAKLTEVGWDVLNGAQDNIALNGIDRWVGGCHMREGADVWYFDDVIGHLLCNGPKTAD